MKAVPSALPNWYVPSARHTRTTWQAPIVLVVSTAVKRVPMERRVKAVAKADSKRATLFVEVVRASVISVILKLSAHSVLQKRHSQTRTMAESSAKVHYQKGFWH